MATNSLNSLPTIEQVNRINFYNQLQRTDPALYMIRIALDESGVNPTILPHIIRTIANLTFGTGYGKVQIFMQARVITQIKPEESVEVNQKAVL